MRRFYSGAAVLAIATPPVSQWRMNSVFYSTPLPPPPDQFNMAEYVLAGGLSVPEKPALELWDSHGCDTYSHADIRKLVLTAAAVLQQNGVEPDDRVLMRLGNELAFPITYLACLWLGAVPIPTSAQLTRPEISKIADQIKPDLLIWSRGVALPENRQYLRLDVDALFPSTPPALPDAHRGDPNRLGYIIFTSGTTQGPRGVCHAHRAIWARQMMFEAWYGMSKADRLMHAGAFNWTYTLGTGLMDPWTLGATSIIPKPGTKSSELPHLVTASKATIFAASPGVYRQILNSETDLPLPTLRHGLSAGEKLAPSLKTRWRNLTNTDVHEALGMSECSTFISGSPQHPADDLHAGWPQPGRKIAVLGSDGMPVPVGDPGTLAVHKSDPGLCLGYLDATLPEGDWFLTGDTVSMAQDGAITYLGRDDDMLNAGGFRVSPVEVESAFVGFQGIVEAAALAVSPKPDTEVIGLIYAAETPVSEDELRAHAQSLLARYKQPRVYIHRPLLPKGANGKLNRKSLRSEIESAL